MTSLTILDSNHVLNMLLANTFSHSVGPKTEVALSYPPCLTLEAKPVLYTHTLPAAEAASACLGSTGGNVDPTSP